MPDMFEVVAVGDYDPTTDTLRFDQDALDALAAEAWAKHPNNTPRYRVGDDGTVYDHVDRIIGSLHETVTQVHAKSMVYGTTRPFYRRDDACEWLLDTFLERA